MPARKLWAENSPSANPVPLITRLTRRATVLVSIGCKRPQKRCRGASPRAVSQIATAVTAQSGEAGTAWMPTSSSPRLS